MKYNNKENTTNFKKYKYTCRKHRLFYKKIIFLFVSCKFISFYFILLNLC